MSKKCVWAILNEGAMVSTLVWYSISILCTWQCGDQKLLFKMYEYSHWKLQQVWIVFEI